MKRIFDLILITIFSPLIFLLLIVFYLLGLIFQGHPVFFTQYRGGYKNQKIKIYKFRTMKKKTKKYNTSITPYGKILRKFKIDEIPQFLNIIKGIFLSLDLDHYIMSIKNYIKQNTNKGLKLCQVLLDIHKFIQIARYLG